MGLFDRIRDSLGGRSTGQREGIDRGAGTQRVGVDPDDPRKVGGHGTHWDALPGVDVRAAMAEAVQDGERIEGGAVGGERAVGHVHPGGRSVRTCAVSVGGELRTAYPVGDGLSHEVTVEEVIEWANDVEAQLRLTLADLVLGAFDTAYFARPEDYTGDSLAFELSAFAYDLERVEEASTDEGEQYSVEGSVGVAPFEGGDLDEFVCRSTPERVVETQFREQRVYRVRVPLIQVEGGEDVAATLYVDRDVAGFRPQEGRSVEGVIWLQGRPA